MFANVPTAPDSAQVAISRARFDEAGTIASEFRISVGELHAERRRFGVDSVAAPDRERVLVFDGTRLQRFKETVDIGE